MEYHIKPLSKQNLKDVQYLYRKVFNNKVNLYFVTKKFDTSYLRKNYFGHLAYYNNEPVAFHGAIPVAMTYNKKTELAAQYGDAMTIKEHTGKGLFTKLGKLTDTLLQQEGITFVWGFPNQNSQYGYLHKLDWQYKTRMHGFKIKTSKLPIEKVLQKTILTKKMYQQYIEKVFLQYKVDEIINGSVFIEDNVVTVKRDKDYFTYKNFTNNFCVKISETLFWIKINNGVLVGDIKTKSKNHFYDSLKTLKKIAAHCGIQQIIFQSPPNTLIYNFLTNSNCEHFESWIIGYKNFNSAFPLENLKLTFGDLDTF